LFGAFVAINADHTGGPGHDDAQLGFETKAGRKMSIDKQAYTWDESFNDSAYESWSRDQGRTLMFDWNTQTSDGTPIMWSDIAAGRQDVTIDLRATELKSFAAPAFLMFEHEPETKVGLNGTVTDFVNAYKHVHDRLVADGVTNLSYVWTLMAFTFTMNNQDQYYPGDSYVDLVGADGYNWYSCPGRSDPWTSFSDVFDSFYNWGVAKGKPAAINEFGSMEDPQVPGHKAQWITDAATTMKAWPDVKAAMYYDNGTPAAQCDWWVDTSDTALASYQDMGADPYFNPPPPLVTISSGPPVLDDSTSATFTFSSNVQGSTFSCSVDAGAGAACWSPYTYTNLSQGAHTARIVATAQGLSNYVLYGWTADTVPPVLTVNWGPAEYTNDTSASFNNVSSEDAPPGWYTCQLDGGTAQSCGSWMDYDNLADGLHAYVAQAFDGAGNGSAPVTRTWTVDTVPPVATITSGPPSLSNSKTATFTFTSNEQGSTFKCSKDGGGYVTCTSPSTYTGVTDGPHTVSVIATDPAKNQSVPVSWAWTVDATKPVVTISSGPPTYSNSTTATFVFSASEPGTFTCQLDSGSPVGCTSPWTLTGLAQGNHTETISATDLAGNVGTALDTWTVDSVPPVVTLLSTPKALSNTASATFKFSSNEAGSTFSCKLDSGTASACTSPKTYTGLLDGSHTFTVTATDKAGNVSSPVTYTWTIDTVKPVATLTGSPPSLSNSKTATFTFTSNEQGSTFKCSLDAGTFSTCTTPKTFTWLADGSHTFKVEAIDPSGNIGTPVAYTWTVDATKPTVTITSGPSNPSSSTTATFTFTASEGNVTFTCQLDSGTPGTCTSPKTYTGLSTGQHTFSVFATDLAGNVGATVKWNWSIQGFGTPRKLG